MDPKDVGINAIMHFNGFDIIRELLILAYMVISALVFLCESFLLLGN